MEADRIKRRAGVAAFTAVVIAFIAFCTYEELKTDKPPVITLSDSVSNEFSVTVTNEELMEGVSASDPEDGDVTGTVIIESMSQITSRKTRFVTYAAFDSANNVTKLEREITYTDYRSPEIKAKSALEFSSGVTLSQIIERLECIDVIDGDISDKIIFNGNLNLLTVGTHTLPFEVTNSCGDMVSQSFEVVIT